MLGGLAAQLFTHEKVRTTEAKAKALRPLAEHLITFAKRAQGEDANSVHLRRQVLRTIPDRDVVHKLFSEIGPRYEEREGGYTRILKLGQRKGDGAPMAIIELLGEDEG
jgi:large subunit ribosomal protein L17